MGGGAYVARVLAENLAQHLAQRAPAGAAVAHEHDRDLGLFVWMLYSPSHPVDGIGVDVVVTRGQDLVDVFAHESPLAAPRRDAPAAPEIELAVDDGFTRRLEDDAGVLPPLCVLQPPAPHIHGPVANHDMAVDVVISHGIDHEESCRQTHELLA